MDTNPVELLCLCGSNLPYRDIYDTKGIFIARVCDQCKERKLAEYKQKVEDFNYSIDGVEKTY